MGVREIVRNIGSFITSRMRKIKSMNASENINESKTSEQNASKIIKAGILK